MSSKEDLWGKTVAFCTLYLVKEIEEWEEVVSMHVHFCSCDKIAQEVCGYLKMSSLLHDNLETTK